MIITGGAGVIGGGLCRHLGGAGASIVIVDVNPEATNRMIAELEAAGVACSGLLCDVADRAGCRATVAEAAARFGRIDGLVNAAMRLGGRGALVDTREEFLDAKLESGVKGTLWMMQAVYPYMKKAGWGRIVNVGSAAVLVGFKGFGAYTAAKAGTMALTRTAAREWYQDGIVVNTICPFANAAKGRKLEYPTAIPAPDDYLTISYNIAGTLSPAMRDSNPELDFGPVLEFLLSDACRFMTGQTLMLDGGIYALA